MIAFWLEVFSVSLVAGLAAVAAMRRAHHPTAVNYRGQRLPVILGAAIAVAVCIAIATAMALDGLFGTRSRFRPSGLGRIVGGLALVFLAGLYDDLRGGPARGLLQHGRALLRGEVTSGIVKLVAAVLAGALVALTSGRSDIAMVIGTLLIAGATNLWNLFDVAPGRALKFFLPVALVLSATTAGTTVSYVAAATLGGAVAMLPLDLRERGMLGDAGANLLGFVVGVALYNSVGLPGLVTALAIVTVLHVLSEWVTLSRLIGAIPPLRSFDRIGRIPVPQTPTAEGFPASIEPRGA